MFAFLRLLPWEYAIRNLFRRPLRTLLTYGALTTVIVLVFTVIGFIRGLERSLAVSGDPNTAVLSSLGMGRNLEYSSIPMRTADLVSASVPGIQQRYGQRYVSPELYLGTQVTVHGRPEAGFGLVRGVTQSALLVRRQVDIIRGDWPSSGQVMVGRMVATKLGHGEQAEGTGQHQYGAGVPQGQGTAEHGNQHVTQAESGGHQAHELSLAVMVHPFR